MKFALSAVLYASVISSSAPLMPTEYTLLCVGESSRGFNWRAGGWVNAEFQPSKFIVSRKPQNQCFSLKVEDPGKWAGDKFYFRDVCLNIREFGEEYKPILSSKCTEHYYIADNGKWQKEFSCSQGFTNISGSFDGLFRVFSDSSVNSYNPGDYRDSLAITVGKCSMM